MIEPYYCAPGVTLYLGDCIEVMRELHEASVDAVVCDPPYGLEFMGRAWDRFDGAAFDPAFGHWLAGFIDGEGCFHVHKKPQNTYDCQFSITLRGDDMPILERCQRTTGLGTIALTTPADTNPKARWTVSSKAHCVALRDLLRAFPLRAKKAREFEEWSVALDAWLTHERGEWADMAESRDRLMAMRAYDEAGIRVDPFQMWVFRWAREAYRVLKPGGHLAAFGGTRTHHRLVCGIEDAGFEIRDECAYMFGSGFPKSLDVSKAIDKLAGAEREVTGKARGHVPTEGGAFDDDAYQWQPEYARRDAPATEDAQRWQGWGTALKPAHEPICLARKPLAGTVAQNVLRHGTGALNIDGTRIASGPSPSIERRSAGIGAPRGMFREGFNHDAERYQERRPGEALGRWPANVLLDEIAAELLDAQAGELRARGNTSPTKRRQSNGAWAANGATFGVGPDGPVDAGDRGGPSRFFFTAKASRREREAGLEDLTPELRTDGRPPEGPGADNPRLRVSERHNDHPTVKPIALMRWLVRLVTPPGGTVLDPFLGSGTTALAALDERMQVIGIDMTARYVEIARYRVTHRHVLDTTTREPDEAVPQGRLF